MNPTHFSSIFAMIFGVPTAARIENSYQGESHSDSSVKSEKEKNFYGCLQNGQITQFYFKKLQEQELALSLITVINLYLIVFSADISFPQLEVDAISTLDLSLYFTSVSAVIAMALIALRTQTLLQLQKEQKLIYEKAGLVSSKKVLYLLGEWLIFMVQPYPFLVHHTFSTSNKEVGYSIEYPANDLLTILSFGRIYIILRTILLLTPYMNNRSGRLCKMYGCRADYSYSIKCMFKDHPLKLICLFYLASAAVFAYLVYIAERQLLIKATQDDKIAMACTNYHNAFWLILITTSTVGYGDYYPQTPLGRIIILFVAIWGTLIVSVMVVVVSNTLSMQKTQLRTSKILNKLQLRQQLQEKAATVIGYLLLSTSKKHKQSSRQNRFKLIKAKNQFAETRKSIREMAEVNDLEDEIASHFLKLNNDIETLNANQDKIIDFVHKNFNAEKQSVSCIPEQAEEEEEEDEDGAIEQPKFMKLFKNQLKQKLA